MKNIKKHLKKIKNYLKKQANIEKIKKIFLYITLTIISIFICLGTIENGILLTLLSFIIIYIFVTKVKIDRFHIFLLLFCLVTKIAAVLILKIPILADYSIMLEGSKKVILGDLSFVNDYYFLNWGYQLFHVFYQALMLKIINNILFLKILNCIYATIITVLIYNIIKKLTNEKTARITSLIYSISLYPIYINSVLGNQQLSLMLILFAVYLLLFKKQSNKNLIIIGVLFGISHLERTEGIIYLLTTIIYFIFTNKNIKETIIKTLIITLTFFTITKVPSYIMVKAGVNDIGFGNSNPEWKFLLGFNQTSKGKNNVEDEIYLADKELEKEEIINRMTDFKNLPKLFYEKIKIQWLYDDLEDTFNVKTTTQFSQNFMNIFINYIKIINLFIITLVFYGLYKNKKIDKINYFFLINIFIYFGVYLLIEVSARYYYNPQVSIIILSSLGISKLINIIDKKYKKA